MSWINEQYSNEGETRILFGVDHSGELDLIFIR